MRSKTRSTAACVPQSGSTFSTATFAEEYLANDAHSAYLAWSPARAPKIGLPVIVGTQAIERGDVTFCIRVPRLSATQKLADHFRIACHPCQDWAGRMARVFFSSASNMP